MSERLPWFRCVPSALLGALAGMRADEGYVYVVLLMRIYETGGPVAETERTLSRRTGMTERKVAAALLFLIETAKVCRLPDGRLDSVSTHGEIQWQQERRRDQSRAGKASRNKTNASSAKTDKYNEGQIPQQNQQKGPTAVQQAPNHIDIERDIGSVALATGAGGAVDPTKAVRDRLWMDGPAALVGMGQREHTARALIGRWLKMTGDDPGRVHAAIEEAQRSGTADPIPYIARVLNDQPQTRGPPRSSPRVTNSDLARGFAERLRAKQNGQHHNDQENGSTSAGFFGGGGDDPTLFERGGMDRPGDGPILDLEPERSDRR